MSIARFPHAHNGFDRMLEQPASGTEYPTVTGLRRLLISGSGVRVSNGPPKFFNQTKAFLESAVRLRDLLNRLCRRLVDGTEGF